MAGGGKSDSLTVMAAKPHSSLKNLAAAVCLLIVISSAAALYSIHASGLNHGRSLKRFDEFKEAINCARVAQVSFKTQVQEWKNILLRGQTSADYEEYLRRFTESESRVDTELKTLSGLVAALELEPGEAEKLLIEHATLGRSYRAALESYRKGDVASILAVDRSVRGMDRKMNEEIDALVGKIDAKGDNYLEKFSAQAEESETYFRRLLLVLSIVTILAAFTFIFQALRLQRAAA